MTLYDLYSRYAQALRLEDLDAIADCFTADARFELDGAPPAHGVAAIRALIASAAPGRPRHHIPDIWGAENQGASVSSRAHFALLDVHTGETLAFGHYEDTAVRDGEGVWR